MKKTFQTETAGQTEALAQQLLPEILNKRIVLLSGALGSGKTTFVKGLAKALGIMELIKSPTYTYVNTYKLKAKSYNLLLHFDLYRLPESSEHPEQVKASVGLEEALENPENLVVIEWPERLPLPNEALHLRFEKNENSHTINLFA